MARAALTPCLLPSATHLARMQDTTLEFTDEEKHRLDTWYEAGKPGTPHEWLGMAEADYAAKRAAQRASIERFLDSPQIQLYFAIAHASRIADTTRWEDDGGPPLPDGFKQTREFRNAHLRPDYVARRLF
jgi:hypothetical protein